MATHIVRSPEDWGRLAEKVAAMSPPLTITIMQGARRSNAQNDMQHAIYEEVARHFGDRTALDVKAESKLRLGVPILRRDDAEFRAVYDDKIREAFDYETKLLMMGEPVNFPVTSRMTTKQSAEYTDWLYRYWSEQGVRLTEPRE